MSLNKVQLIGRLGADPEQRHMPNGKPVANVRIATSETWRDKTTGDKQERTEWHNVVAYNRLAEVFGEYLRKGSLVYVEGKLQTRKWQDKDGKDRYTTEIVAREMQMLGGRREGDAQPQQQGNGFDWKAAEKRERERTAAENVREAMEEPAFDDDIPF